MTLNMRCPLLPAASLPEDPYARRQLYVRACYHQLFDIMAKHRAVLLIGTPGIGKVGAHMTAAHGMVVHIHGLQPAAC